jgi:hypothetical protein
VKKPCLGLPEKVTLLHLNLLDLIYINDLHNCSSLLSLLFADDTFLRDSDSDLENLMARVNSKFKKVVYYSRAHKLVLPPGKTKFMIFSHTNFTNCNTQIVVNIDFNNFINYSDPVLKTEIEFVNRSTIPVIKFLGVLFGLTLNFKYLISSIFSKIAKSICNQKS